MSTFLENRHRTTDKKAPLVFLELSAPSFPDSLYLVNDTRPWTVSITGTAREFIALPFRFKLPEDVADSASTLSIEVDNVGRNMSEELENMQPNEVMTARLMLSDRSDPGNFFKTFVLPINRVTINQSVATATGGMDVLYRQQAVRKRANAFTLPGLF